MSVFGGRGGGPYGAIRGEIPVQLYAFEEVVCNDLGFSSLFLNKQTNKQLYTVKGSHQNLSHLFMTGSVRRHFGLEVMNQHIHPN